MRLLPTLLLACILVPISHQTTAANAGQPKPLCQRLCASTLSDVNKATLDGDASTLIGMLYPRGVTVTSPDGSVSQASLEQAIRAWNDALGERIFRLARLHERAIVTARKVDKIEVQDDLQGQVSAATDEHGHLTAKILVCATNGERPLSDREVGSVVTHEFGHLLGLDDAPDGIPSGTYIMDGFDPNHLVLKPAPSEVAAVEDLRATIRDDIQFVEMEQP